MSGDVVSIEQEARAIAQRMTRTLIEYVMVVRPSEEPFVIDAIAAHLEAEVLPGMDRLRADVRRLTILVNEEINRSNGFVVMLGECTRRRVKAEARCHLVNGVVQASRVALGGNMAGHSALARAVADLDAYEARAK